MNGRSEADAEAYFGHTYACSTDTIIRRLQLKLMVITTSDQENECRYQKNLSQKPLEDQTYYHRQH